MAVALIAVAVPVVAELEAGFGTTYHGSNADGTHNWQITFTNLSPHASSDYSIFQLDIPTAIVSGSTPTTDKQWDLLSYENQQPDPADNYFVTGTSTPGEYIVPMNDYYALWGFNIITINFKTPTNYTRLARGTITAHSESAGELAVEGLLPVPPGTNAAPAAWLTAYGLSRVYPDADLLDADGDGHANWQEYIADTNPTNAQSVLSLTATPSNVIFQTSENCLYSVEVCGALVSNVWNFVTNDLPGSGNPVAIDLPTNYPAFYRLKAERISW